MSPEIDIEDVSDADLPEVVALGICDCGEPGGKVVQVYLTRRNLTDLLNKLDANKRQPGSNNATLIKNDTSNPRYPQSHSEIFVTAVEDEDYYVDRRPGRIRWFGDDVVPS